MCVEWRGNPLDMIRVNSDVSLFAVVDWTFNSPLFFCRLRFSLRTKITGLIVCIIETFAHFSKFYVKSYKF